MHLFIFSACLVTPSTAWEWFMSSPGSWCPPDNIVVLVHYALTYLVFSITDLATIHGLHPHDGACSFGCQVRTSK